MAVVARRGQLTLSLRRESDQRCTQALDFRVGRRKRIQFQNAEWAPIAAKKANDGGTAIKNIRKVNKTTAPALEAEQGRHLACLYGLGDNTVRQNDFT